MNKVKAVIFDYGGVLCKLPTEGQVDELASLCRLPKDRFLKHFWDFRLAYDRGDYDDRGYWRAIARAAGTEYLDWQISVFVDKDVHFWLTLDEPMREWNRVLRSQGFKTAVLSNMPSALGIHLRRHTNLLSEFDVVTLSYEVRSAKPESKIYRSCLAQLGLKAGDALFLDDKTPNVHAAQAVGLHAVTFSTRAHFAGRDEQYGLPPIPTDG